MSDYNYYMDESCYLQNDDSRYMVLGAISCMKQYCHNKSSLIKKIKISNKLNPNFEIKSTKISMSKYSFYKELLDYFFNDDNLRFRAIIIDKFVLKHSLFNQTHDEFYYKMTYRLFERFISGDNNFIYLDYKDNHSDYNCKKLSQYLYNHFYKFGINVRCQPINSKESNLLQLTDFLIGLVAYNARQLDSNQAKIKLINQIKVEIGQDIFNTNYNEKFNIFLWDGHRNV